MAKKIIKIDDTPSGEASVLESIGNDVSTTEEVLIPDQEDTTEEKQDPDEKTETGPDVVLEEKQDPDEKNEVEVKSDLRSKMQPYFDHNPGVEIFYVASDNCPFYSKSDAEGYQKKLDPSEIVKPIKR
jgi:hypothetical protein